VTSDNRKAVAGADIVLLCVKPQLMREVLEEIRPHVGEKALVISVAASVPTSYIEHHLGPKVPVVRAMPNTCSAVGCGMTGICRGAHAAAEHLEMARDMFDAVGRTVVVDEKHMDAVTGLSASGPAFAYIILESAGRSGSQSRPAARRGHVAGRADDEGLSERGAGDGRPSSAVERRGNDAGGLHD
jgi:pyrroline-5-carboxylate reductase